jgi:hypothetical protein
MKPPRKSGINKILLEAEEGNNESVLPLRRGRTKRGENSLPSFQKLNSAKLPSLLRNLISIIA